MKTIFILGLLLATNSHGQKDHHSSSSFFRSSFEYDASIRHLDKIPGPKFSVNGWKLHAQYSQVINFEKRSLQVHRQEFDYEVNTASKRVLEPVKNYTWGKWNGSTKKKKIMDLMFLNYLSYPKGDHYNDAVMGPIFENNDGLFGSSLEEEIQWLKNEFDMLYQDAGVESYYVPNKEVAENVIGIVALEWKSDEIGTVLVFRGSYSKHDYHNIKLWVKDWILEKMSAQTKMQWVELAKLPWTEEMKERENKIDVHEETAIRAGSYFYVNGVPGTDDGTFAKTWAKHAGVSAEEAASQGYWPQTKALVASVIETLKPNENLIFSGHSQGGARAALASMWQEKQGKVYEAVTFGAVGGTCFSRNLGYENADYLSDVDPFVQHEQIVDYVDVLDIFGFFDIDPGMQCVYGVTDAATRKAKTYCEKVFGFSGPKLMFAGTSGYNQALLEDFKRCRYFTHFAPSMMHNLDIYLKDDGTSDGGCKLQPVIDAADTKKQCPTGEVPLSFFLTVGGIALFSVSGLILLICCGCAIKRSACGKKISPNKQQKANNKE